eukprot:9006010-Pyramimonas_sp.AAC.1
MVAVVGVFSKIVVEIAMAPVRLACPTDAFVVGQRDVVCNGCGRPTAYAITMIGMLRRPAIIYTASWTINRACATMLTARWTWAARARAASHAH